MPGTTFPGIVTVMVREVGPGGDDLRLRAAAFARQRREDLGLTQAEVATAAGVRDVKTIRNLETGRNWPNDLTRRGIETALRIEIGTLDRLSENGPTGAAHTSAPPASTLPTAQELIDLSSAITRLSSALEGMLRRGDDDTADTVRGLINGVSAVMAGYAPVLQSTQPNLIR